MSDISNRFLSVEIVIPFVLLAIGGMMSYASLSADVEHKASREDVAVLKAEVDHIKETTAEIQKQVNDNSKILNDNAKILIRIESKLDNGDN